MNGPIQIANQLFERANSGTVSRDQSIEMLRRYFFHIRKSAYSGDAEGQFLLGTLYQEAQFMRKINTHLSKKACQKKAFYWFEKACAQDHPYACHNLGGIYGTGSVVPRDTNKERSLYQKAFRLGLTEAGYALAMTYKEQLNYAKAISLLKCVLTKVPNDGEATFQLAKFYYEGLGVKKSYRKAYHLFCEAATSDYITECSKEEVLFYIGKMYFYGYYPEQSFAKAKYLLEQANKDGDHEDITTFCEANAEILQSARKTKVIL